MDYSTTIANKLSTNTILLKLIGGNYDNDVAVMNWAQDADKWLVLFPDDARWEDYGCDTDQENIEYIGHTMVAVAYLNPEVLEDCSGAQGVIYLDDNVLKMENHQGEIFNL